jgi:hypothetical protein
MRFTEIASPEEQLALWKLVSDKMWAAFGQRAQQHASPVPSQQLVTSAPKPLGKRKSASPKSQKPKKATMAAAPRPLPSQKPKKATMAAAPRPLPKPKPQQLTPTQAKKQKAQQHQQLAQHIQQALIKKPLTTNDPKPIQPQATTSAAVGPMKNNYSERDKDELVLHRRENPFKSIGDHKPL